MGGRERRINLPNIIYLHKRHAHRAFMRSRESTPTKSRIDRCETREWRQDRYRVDGCVYKHNIECCATPVYRSMLFSGVNVSENNLKHTFLFTQIRVPFGLIKKRFETFNVRRVESEAILCSVDNKWNCFDFILFRQRWNVFLFSISSSLKWKFSNNFWESECLKT